MYTKEAKTNHESWLAYVVAVVGTAAAVAIRSAIAATVGEMPVFIVFYPVVLLSAALGGLRPGLVATVLTGLAADYFLMEPRGAFGIKNTIDATSLAFFAAINLGISITGEMLRRAHQVTRSSEVRYRRLFEAAQDGVFLVDPKTRKITDVNPFMSQLLGYSPEELVGRELWEIGLVKNAEGSRTVFDQLAREGHVRYEDLPLRAKTGETREIEFVSNLYDEHGRAVIQCHIRDITQRKQAEKALRESQAILDKVLAAPTFGVLFFTLEGRMTDVNQALLHMLGYTRDEFLALKDWHHLTPPEFGEITFHAASNLATIGETLPYEKQWIRKDGSRFWGLFAPARLSGTGSESQCIEFVIDVTEGKRAEDELRGLQEQLKAELEAMNRLHDLSTRFFRQEDMQTLFGGILEAAIELVGAQRGHVHLLNRSSGELPIVAQRGLDQAFVNYFSHIKQGQIACGAAVQSSECVVVEDVTKSALFLADPQALELKVASQIRAMICTPLLTHAGDSVGVLSVDFTQPHIPSERDLRLLDLLARQAADFIEREQAEKALRQSEEQLKAASFAAEIGVWSWVPGTNDVIVSANWRGLFGVAPDAPVTFESWRSALHPEDRERVVAEIYTAIEQHQAFTSEYRIVRPDDTILWIVDRGRAWYDEKGRAIGMAGVNVDITKRKQTEESLRQAKEELAQANQELERQVAERTAKMKETMEELEHFSYTITHDMRAPLRAMQGFGHLLLGQCEDCLHPQGRDFLRKIAESASRMDSLITDALNYTKIVRKDFPLEPVNTDKLLRSMVESYPQFQWPKAEIRIAGNLPVVLANEAGLTQCFSNLLGNAVKFVKPGQVPRVRVWAENRDDYVRFWFEDNGIGIARRHQQQIFDMFQRLSRDYEGTGIGLALVSKAVERMHGKIGVESEEGQGSRFWIELKSCESNTPTYAREAAVIH